MRSATIALLHTPDIFAASLDLFRARAVCGALECQGRRLLFARKLLGGRGQVPSALSVVAVISPQERRRAACTLMRAAAALGRYRINLHRNEKDYDSRRPSCVTHDGSRARGTCCALCLSEIVILVRIGSVLGGLKRVCRLA